MPFICLGIMAPAIGICYLYLRKPLKLWLIDTGHFIALERPDVPADLLNSVA